jgi:hypothetical protein
MSVITEAVNVPKQIIKPLLNPKTLLIGAGITAGSLFLLSSVFSGVGALVGLRINPLMPKLHPSLAVFPFVPLSGMAAPAIVPTAAPQNTGSDIIDSSVNSAAGYVNAMLQVT